MNSNQKLCQSVYTDNFYVMHAFEYRSVDRAWIACKAKPELKALRRICIKYLVKVIFWQICFWLATISLFMPFICKYLFGVQEIRTPSIMLCIFLGCVVVFTRIIARNDTEAYKRLRTPSVYRVKIRG